MIIKPVGKIVQKRYHTGSKMPYYVVSFFNGRFKRQFDLINDAKVYAENHARSLISEKIVRTVTISYTRINGYTTYLTYNSYFSEDAFGNDAVEYESSAYDYYNNLFFRKKYWLKASQINERHYSYEDVLRVGLVRSKFRTFAASITMLAFVSVIIAFLFSIINNLGIENNYAWHLHTIIYAAMIVSSGSGVFYIVGKFKITTITKNNFAALGNVRWKKIHQARLKRFYIQTVLSLILISISIGLTVALWDSSPKDISIQKANRSDVIVLMVFSTIMFLQLFWSYLNIFVKMSKVIVDLYDEEGFKGFKRWLNNRSLVNEFKTAQNFFLLPVEYSSSGIEMEQRVTEEFLVRQIDEETEEYLKRSKQRAKFAMKKHIAIIEGTWNGDL